MASDPVAAPDLIARARELHSNATAGPWHVADANGGEQREYAPFWVIGHERVSIDRRDGEAPEDWLMELHCGDRGDATFIAAARELVPALADALEDTQARLDAAEQIVQGRAHARGCDYDIHDSETGCTCWKAKALAAIRGEDA